MTWPMVSATEYNLVARHENDTERLMNTAGNLLFVAETIGQVIQNKVFASNQWDLANGCSGVTGACYDLLQIDKGFQRAPQYFAFPLWNHFGPSMVSVTSNLDAVSVLSVYAGQVNSSTYSINLGSEGYIEFRIKRGF